VRVDNDTNYTAYVKGRKIHPVVQTLLQETSEVGIPEIIRLQEHFRDYKITVYQGLRCDDIMFEGQVDASKRINLLYDDIERRYHVTINVTRAMAKYYVCKACNKSCSSEKHTSVNRRVAIVWPALRARSPKFVSPAMSETGILEVGRVSPSTSGNRYDEIGTRTDTLLRNMWSTRDARKLRF